jgi:hypothetical protein
MIIELAKTYPDRKAFEAWLKEQGHEIDRGGVKTYVNGDDVSIYPFAAEALEELEKQFKGE